MANWKAGDSYAGIVRNINKTTSRSGNSYAYVNIVQNDSTELGLPIEADIADFLEWCGVQAGTEIVAYCHYVHGDWPRFGFGSKDIFAPPDKKTATKFIPPQADA